MNQSEARLLAADVVARAVADITGDTLYEAASSCLPVDATHDDVNTAYTLLSKEFYDASVSIFWED